MARERCPSVDAAAVAEFRRRTPAPPGPVSRRQAQAWLDAYEASEIRKNRTGQRLIAEYERCRDPAASPVTS